MGVEWDLKCHIVAVAVKTKSTESAHKRLTLNFMLQIEGGEREREKKWHWSTTREKLVNSIQFN